MAAVLEQPNLRRELMLKCHSSHLERALSERQTKCDRGKVPLLLMQQGRELLSSCSPAVKQGSRGRLWGLGGQHGLVTRLVLCSPC